MSIVPGTLFSVRLSPETVAHCKLVFESQLNKHVVGLACYGCATEPSLAAFDSPPIGRDFTSTFAVDDLISKYGQVLGAAPVTEHDLRACRYVDKDQARHGDEPVASEIEDELCRSTPRYVGAEAIVISLQQICGLLPTDLAAQIQKVTAGSTKFKRYDAAFQLARRGPLAIEAKSALLQALHDEGKNVRRMSAIALARITCREATPDPVVVAELERLRSDPIPEVQQAASWAIERMTDANAPPTIIYI